MDKNDKQGSYLMFQIAYTQISYHVSSPAFNTFFMLLQYLLMLCKCYDLIDPTLIHTLEVPYFTVFIALAALLAAFILLTVFSYYFLMLNTLWLYFLLFLESISIIYIEMTVRCFSHDSWCGGDSKLQISSVILLIVFSLVVYLRSHTYYPFYDSSNHLAMNTGRAVICVYIYALFLSLITNGILMSNEAESKQVTFIITAVLYAFMSKPPAASPFVCRIISVSTMSLLWTTALIWLAPVITEIISKDSYSERMFWYYWGYTIPIVLGLSFVQSNHFTKGYEWKLLFFQENPQNLRDLYLQCNSLIKVMQKIKTSQLRTNSPQFKQLWELIGIHNDKCQNSQCPLSTILTLKMERGDELLEQKRFNRTVQKTLQFGHQKLSNQRDQYPNLIELNLELAHFELQVFHQRTKGLQLFNRQFNKEERSKEEQWGLFYMKKRIQSFDGSGEMRASGESQEEISVFKHDIEVSVTMLAEFWYFLSDPKCNLKKLYDLANVLFPLKIGVDQAWKSIHQLRNIECYHLYARYLIKMFNDKQKGLKILQQARKLEAQSHEKQQVLAGSEGALSEEHGVIFLQFDGKNSGIMYQVNTACEKIFGYNKGELQGRKVNDIMPKLIAFHHDRILENYQQTNRPKMMNKQRSIWGRSKDGYLFPFTICIKPVRNYFSQTSEVYASVKRDLWMREIAFFFTDCDYNLSDISGSLLGMFPDLHGRTHLKKKINITEIIPDFQKVQEKIINQKETHQFMINRSYEIYNGESFTESILLTLQGETFTIGVSGLIGYFFKISKGTGLSSNNEPNPSASMSGSKVKEINIEASNSYWMKRGNDFKFMASVDESKEDNGSKLMVYHGGLVPNNNETKTLIFSRIQSSFEKTKMQVSNETQGEKAEYGKDIKIKRLYGTAIRQIHEVSEHSQQNGIARADEQEDGQTGELIKPSELNSILERQTGNRNISFLKSLTVIILSLSTTISILLYISYYSHNNNVVDYITKLSSLSSLQAHVMYVNIFANKYSLGLVTNSDISLFRSQINELDSFTSSIPLSISSHMLYNDGTGQDMLLSFAVNKMISESQLLASSNASVGTEPNLFFVLYNSVNGIEIGCESAIDLQKASLMKINQDVIKVYSIYLGASAAAYFLILVIKNLMLRAVLKKKAQILNIFFEIPRVACNSIQKQCERFIQRLSADDNQEQELQAQALESDEQEPTAKKNGRQKKRTIMGEQKTAYNFVIVSLILFVFLLIYPIVCLTLAKTQQSQQEFTLNAVFSMIQQQKQLAKMMSYLNTHFSNDSFPLAGNKNANGMIVNQYNTVNVLLRTIQEKFYYVGEILDESYGQEYNSLFFKSLCVNSSTCLKEFGEDRGLNAIIFYYYDYLIGKYQAHMANDKTPGLLTSPVFEKQDNLRGLIKRYWRKYQNIVKNGTLRYLNRNDSIIFGIMLAICIIDMSVLMWGWIRFYVSLQHKIIATEYILTFIPIDQINKNPKIVRYIKEHILRIH